MLKSWCSTQATIALSSGEAEYYAAVRASAEGLGIQSLMRGLGIEVKVRVWLDASAAKSIAPRAGLGRVRHLETKFLWLQSAVSSKRVELRKIRGEENPADILTKPKSATEILLMVALAAGTLVRREQGVPTDVGACVAQCAPPWLSGVFHTARPWAGAGQRHSIDHLPLRDPRPEKIMVQNLKRCRMI